MKKHKGQKHIHEGPGAHPRHPSKAAFAKTMEGLEGEYRGGVRKGGNDAKRRRDRRLEGKPM